MKKFLILLFLTFILPMHANVFACQNFSAVSVIIKKNAERIDGRKFAPDKGIEIIMHMEYGMVSFDLPFDEYPIDIRIEEMSGLYVCWNDTIFGDGEYIEFNGTTGVYKVVFTIKGSEYIGYFSLI